MSPALFAQVDLSALGRHDSALEWLAKAERDADPELVHLAVRPAYRALAGEAAYRALLMRVGLA